MENYYLRKMSKAIQELKNLEQLLKTEQQADREEYQRKVLSVSIKDRVNQGICWHPVLLKKQYYGTAERLVLEVEKNVADEQEHAFQPGSVISLFTNMPHGAAESRQVTGVVNYVKKNVMVMTMNSDELPDWVFDGKMGVQLLFDEGTYREMFAALLKVRKAERGRLAELREILLGYQPPAFLPAEKTAVEGLNDSQNEALSKILSAKDVALIHGPPGTGKTTTLVEAIFQTLKKETQVLVCAQSNAAVDLLTEKLSDRGLGVLRLGHPARVTEKLLHMTLDARIAEHESYREIKKLRKQAEEYRRMAQKYKRNFGKAERDQRKRLFREAHAVLNQADMLEHYITADLMTKSQVITCTLTGAQHYLIRGMMFSTLFIDEAAQALEPACWIPITKAERVVMAGDHCQLPPTIKSFEAAQQGLEETLFQKIAARARADVMLTTQYRMNETIMRFSSREFYNNELTAHASNKDRMLTPDEPAVTFIDTAGCGYGEYTDKESKSTGNRDEALLVLAAMEEIRNALGEELMARNTVGVITPYKAQVNILRELFEESEWAKWLGHSVAVNTVDAFQGQERDIIIISLVRSNERAEIGFLKDTRRMNVAMTRARKKLVVIGDSATVGNFPFYSRFLDYINEVGGYKSAFGYQPGLWQ